MLVPTLELAKPPGIEPGDDVIGFIHGERLRANKPGALQHVKQDQQNWQVGPTLPRKRILVQISCWLNANFMGHPIPFPSF
jgi:hypothetical protein